MIRKSALFRCFYSILYLLLPLPLIILIWNSDPVKYDSFRMIPMVFGVIAYTMLNVQLILASRPKWLEKWFGMDHLYRIHGFMAAAAIAAAAEPPPADTAGWRMPRPHAPRPFLCDAPLYARPDPSMPPALFVHFVNLYTSF